MRFHGDASHFLPVLLPQLSLHTDVQHHPAGSWARVTVPSGGGLAQLGEHYVRNVGVAGSTPVPSTKKCLPAIESYNILGTLNLSNSL